MNRFLTKKIIASIVALALLVGVGVLISSRDTSSTTRNAALVAGTSCKKPGQVTKVSKQSVICAALSPKNIWYPVFQEKKWVCAKLGGSRKQYGIFSVCGKNKSSKKRWFLTMPLTSNSNAGLPTTDQDAFIKLTTNPELIAETSPTTPIALGVTNETTLTPTTEITRASNAVSTTTAPTSTTTAPRSTTTAPTSTTGDTRPNIVRIPIEVVPAINFGPATPYPERVLVSLYKLGVGTDCSTVSFELVSRATSMRIGSQEIAIFTDIPSGTYYVAIGMGCNAGTVGDFDRRSITTYQVLIDASLPSQLTTPIRLSKTTRSVTASASIRGTQSAITSMTLSGGFLSDDLEGEPAGSGNSTTYEFWGVPPGVYTLTMVQSPYPNRLERITVGDRNLVTPTYEMGGKVVVPTTPILELG